MYFHISHPFHHLQSRLPLYNPHSHLRRFDNVQSLLCQKEILQKKAGWSTLSNSEHIFLWTMSLRHAHVLICFGIQICGSINFPSDRRYVHIWREVTFLNLFVQKPWILLVIMSQILGTLSGRFLGTGSVWNIIESKEYWGVSWELISAYFCSHCFEIFCHCCQQHARFRPPSLKPSKNWKESLIFMYEPFPKAKLSW